MIKSVEIVYEDEWILVALKPENLAVETRRIDEEDLESLLRKQLKKVGAKPYLATINRLDQPVRGLVLFAKTKEAAADLSAQLNAHTMEKIYRARVFGQILPAKGELKDRLYKDARTNTSRVVAKSDPVYAKGKDAVLSYETLENGELEIHLLTGRHHQIRVQLSHAGHPILGDTKYGNAQSIARSKEEGTGRLMLTACRLSFIHPGTKERVSYTCDL